jgi:hypothetical protein
MFIVVSLRRRIALWLFGIFFSFVESGAWHFSLNKSFQRRFETYCTFLIFCPQCLIWGCWGSDVGVSYGYNQTTSKSYSIVNSQCCLRRNETVGAKRIRMSCGHNQEHHAHPIPCNLVPYSMRCLLLEHTLLAPEGQDCWGSNFREPYGCKKTLCKSYAAQSFTIQYSLPTQHHSNLSCGIVRGTALFLLVNIRHLWSTPAPSPSLPPSSSRLNTLLSLLPTQHISNLCPSVCRDPALPLLLNCRHVNG